MNPRPDNPYLNPYLAGIGLGLVLRAAFVILGRSWAGRRELAGPGTASGTDPR